MFRVCTPLPQPLLQADQPFTTHLQLMAERHVLSPLGMVSPSQSAAFPLLHQTLLVCQPLPQETEHADQIEVNQVQSIVLWQS